MRNVTNYLLLMGLILCSPPVFSAGTIVTPGAGFVLGMDDLVNISTTQGTDTVLRGATQVDGYWDYFIEGTVTIRPDDVLQINSGDRLVFRPGFNSSLEIEGQLDASGQALDDIILTSLADYTVQYGTGSLPFSTATALTGEQLVEEAMTSDLTTHKGLFAITSISGVTGPAPGDWYALTFRFLQGQPRSLVRYVTIRGAEIGINCLNVPENTLTVEYCTIEWNHTGIFLNNASPEIANNRNISYNLIKLLGGNLVRSTGCAIYLTGSSNPLIRQNTFIGNQGNVILIAGKGVSPTTPLPRLGNILDPTSPGRNNFLIHYNDPPFNTPAGRVGQRHVYNETGNTIYAHRNYWGVNDASLIDSLFIYDDDEDSLSGPVLYQAYLIQPTAVGMDVWGGYR